MSNEDYYFYSNLEKLRKDLNLSPKLFSLFVKFTKNRDSVEEIIDHIQTDSDIYFLVFMSFLYKEIDEELVSKKIKHKDLELKIGKKNIKYKNLYLTNEFFDIIEFQYNRLHLIGEVKKEIYSTKNIKKHIEKDFKFDVKNILKEINSDHLLELLEVFKDNKKELKTIFIKSIESNNFTLDIISKMINNYSDKISFTNAENPLIVFLNNNRHGNMRYLLELQRSQTTFNDLINTFYENGFFKDNRKFKKSLDFSKNKFLKNISSDKLRLESKQVINKIISKYKFLQECKD